MLKRERERVNGNTKPSSSKNVSDRRNRESLRQRDVSRQNSSSHEVTAEQRVQTLEVRPVASLICLTTVGFEPTTFGMLARCSAN